MQERRRTLTSGQGQFFPYFIVTLTSFVTIPVTYSLLKPSKGAQTSQLGSGTILTLYTELENTATRIPSEFVPEHADLIEKQRKKQKRRERRIKRAITSVLGWTIIAGMIYLISITSRTAPQIWNPYEVLGISTVCAPTLLGV